MTLACGKLTPKTSWYIPEYDNYSYLMSLFANYLHSGFIYIDWVFKLVFWFGFIFLIGLWFINFP